MDAGVGCIQFIGYTIGILLLLAVVYAIYQGAIAPTCDPNMDAAECARFEQNR